MQNLKILKEDILFQKNTNQLVWLRWCVYRRDISISIYVIRRASYATVWTKLFYGYNISCKHLTLPIDPGTMTSVAYSTHCFTTVVTVIHGQGDTETD